MESRFSEPDNILMAIATPLGASGKAVQTIDIGFLEPIPARWGQQARMDSECHILEGSGLYCTVIPGNACQIRPEIIE